MRFIVYTVLLSGWIFMWWWTYVHHIKACDISFQSTAGIMTDGSEDSGYPLTFKWSDAVPVISDAFSAWRDSVINALQDDQVLQITGLAYRDESGNHLNLGEQRVRAISRLFAMKIPKSRLLMDTDIGALTADIKGRNFPAFRLRVLTRNAFVEERSACTLIYFPSDTIAQSGYQSILDYATRLQTYLSGTEEFVELHAFARDTLNAPEQNTLTLLDALKELLVDAGIPAGSVLFAENTGDILDHCMPDTTRAKLSAWILLKTTK